MYTFFSNDKKVIDIDKYKHDWMKSKYPVFKNGKLLLCVIQEEFYLFPKWNNIINFASAMQMIIKFANAFIIYGLIRKVLIAQPGAKFKNNNKYVNRGLLDNVPEPLPCLK